VLHRQKLLEEEMITLGVKRYRQENTEAKKGKHESTTPAGIQFIRKGCGKIVKSLDKLKLDYIKGEPIQCEKEVMELLTNSVSSEVVAFLALKACVNHLSTPVKLVKVALEIGSFIEDETRFRAFAKENAPLFGVVTRDLSKRTTNYRKQKRVLVHSANKAGIEWQHWLTSDKTRLGVLLVKMVCESTKLFEIKKHTSDSHKKFKKVYWLEATEASLKWIEDKNSVCELLNPVKMPCLIYPRKWDSVYTGGYYQYTKMNLVKSSDAAYLQQLDNTNLKEVFHATNIVQGTGWRINSKVFEVMEALYDNQSVCQVIPESGQRHMEEPYPKTGTKEEIIEWKRRATLLHSENVRLKTKRIQFAQLMWMTRKFKNEKAIYFPHTLDFRGRMYANTAFLNPQGEDSAKGLLEFSTGKPLGSSGLAWLKVHISNTWGFDKASLEERLEWTENNEDMIQRIGVDPLTSREWMEADKPWQFLRACFEYVCCNNNEDYISHLPVTVDGSCNGLQHFSAMLRDDVGGSATNLINHDKPEDIYEIVREEAEKGMVLDGNPDFTLWGSGGCLSRAIVKRPVMTTPYGATLYGMRDQIHEELKKQLDKGTSFPGIDSGTDLWPHCKYLALHIYEAIGRVVVSSRKGMKWLQDVAKASNKLKRPIYWTLPTGFVVKQKYIRSIVKEVKTIINGRMASLYAGNNDSDKLHSFRQINGISPNFVHSLDACHLMKTIIHAKDKYGIESFSVVHDSFGTHACDIEQLGIILRETFVDIYKKDILENFKKEQGDLEMPSLPKYGKLNIEDVKDAEFFFS
jgi:DNA-directed RNA polymerase